MRLPILLMYSAPLAPIRFLSMLSRRHTEGQIDHGGDRRDDGDAGVVELAGRCLNHSITDVELVHDGTRGD